MEPGSGKSDGSAEHSTERIEEVCPPGAGSREKPCSIQPDSEKLSHAVPLCPEPDDPAPCPTPLDPIEVQVNRAARVGACHHGADRRSGDRPEVQTMPKGMAEKCLQSPYSTAAPADHDLDAADRAPFHGLAVETNPTASDWREDAGEIISNGSV